MFFVTRMREGRGPEQGMSACVQGQHNSRQNVQPCSRETLSHFLARPHSSGLAAISAHPLGLRIGKNSRKPRPLRFAFAPVWWRRRPHRSTPPAAASTAITTAIARKEMAHGSAGDISPRKRRLPMAARAAPAGGVAVDGVLPADLLFEVLLRLSAREVCRLRAVCPSWRSLTYDRTFAAEHAARHPGPLLAMRVRAVGGGSSIDLVGLSGDVVRQISVPERHDYRVLGARSDCVFLRGANQSISVLDPATGSVRALPTGTAEGLVLTGSHGYLHGYTSWTAFGQVSSTGDYKLLRIVQDIVPSTSPLCEVFTFGNGFEQWRKNQSTPAHRDGVGQWSEKESPPFYLDMSCTHGVIVNGSVYFLFNLGQFGQQQGPGYDHRIKNIQPDSIPSFNLETEQWSVALQGPLGRIIQEADDISDATDLDEHLMLAELKGFLVIVYFNDVNFTLDLWFLMDFENSVWSKEHSIRFEFIAKDLVEQGVQLMADDVWDVQPLSVANEGRIILLVRTLRRQILQIYDPRTNSTKCVLEMDHRRLMAGVGIYTGGLLC